MWRQFKRRRFIKYMSCCSDVANLYWSLWRLKGVALKILSQANGETKRANECAIGTRKRATSMSISNKSDPAEPNYKVDNELKRSILINAGLNLVGFWGVTCLFFHINKRGTPRGDIKVWVLIHFISVSFDFGWVRLVWLFSLSTRCVWLMVLVNFEV